MFWYSTLPWRLQIRLQVQSILKQQSIQIQIYEEFEHLVSPDKLTCIANRALEVVPEQSGSGLDIVIADDETVRELNRTHRGLDENTDVLSFSFDHEGEYYGDDGEEQDEKGWAEEFDFIMPPEIFAGLGEVIISYPQVARQAQEAGRSTEHELAHMLIHGILHLMGFDHMEPEEEAIMKELEDRALAKVFADE
jgi:probable rRNA maturation factor